MNSPAVRVGLLGAANIAWRAWAGVHANGMTVTRAGGRDADRGCDFVKRVCDTLKIEEAAMPTVCSYEEFASAADVDVVYMATPVTARGHWVNECIQCEKHVVGERPSPVDAEVLRSWIEALDQRNLLYVDGTMLSRGKRVREVCAAVKRMGGPVKHIFANFTLGGDEAFLQNNIRANPDLEPHGVLGDLGW
ncbi:hypothetical protein CUR178_05454 [Leishmania enriettii]|uniref:Gfo/Idh/MocA-like oxidoreductase N-terminal domain-containing protein n=1 Tax=Leishmania enriettii TaxID=5663 RepID=A0A836HLK9_LEIEN|nr:hypothetical protein CUR178_05454 [Leishmania enriettii]